MGNKTPFYDLHVKANAKIVDFAGWEMPLHYGSQIEEHHKIRQDVGMFDVSHMGVLDIHGHDAIIFLRELLANNIDRITAGKALYTCMLNENGGVIDDLIVYKISDDFYRLVINAGTREKDIAWIKKHALKWQLDIKERNDFVMIALQGPKSKDKLSDILSKEDAEKIIQLKPFTFAIVNDYFISRTGYTGEDGYEIILKQEAGILVWQKLMNSNVAPCGLGARDTLRLEAGLNLYGSDMDEAVTPLESNLAWTVSFEPKERNFIGRLALEKQKENGVKRQLVGLVLEGPGIIRNHQKVRMDGNGEGEVTSGGYSPTLAKSIALARVPVGVGASCVVEIRNKEVPAQVIKPPFVRQGKKMF